MSTVSVIYDLIGRDSASSAFKSASNSASSYESTMSRVSKAVVIAGAAIAAGAVAIGVESVKSAASFQSAMERIHTQADVAQSKIAGLSDGVLKLAGQVGANPDSLAESLYHVESAFASVGITGPKALNLVKIAAEGAKIGGADLVDVTNALDAAVASNIPGVQNYTQAMGALNSIVGAGDMKMQDLAEAFGTGMVATVKGFGLSLTDVGAALATFGDNNIRGSNAATQLRMAVQALAAPAKAGQEQLIAWGVSQGDLSQDMQKNGLLGALEHLEALFKANGVTATEQGQVITQMFGKKAGTGLNVLMDQMDRLKSKYPAITDGADKFGKAVDANNQTAQQQFDRLRGALDALGIRLGLDLLPPVTTFTQFLTSTMLPAAEKVAGKVAAIIPVASIESSIKKVISDVESLYDKLTGTTPAKAKGKPKPVTVTVPYTVKGMSTSGSYSSMVTQISKQAATAKVAPITIPYTLKGMSGAASIADMITKPSASDVAATMPSADSFGDLLSKALGRVNWGKLLADVIEGAVSGAQQIGAAFLTLLGKIDWTQMGGMFANIVVGLAVGLVNNLIPALISEAIHHPLDMVMFILSLIPIGKAAGILIDILDKVPFIGPLAKFFLGPVEKVGEMVESALGKMLGKVFGPVGDLIKGSFKDAGSWLESVGQDIIYGLWYGAEDALKFYVEFWSKIYDATMKPFLKAEVWLFNEGWDILDGLLEGATKLWTESLWPWIKSLGGKIIGLWVKANEWLFDAGWDVLDGLFQGASKLWTETLWPWARSLGTRIIGLWVKSNEWLFTAGWDVLDGLFQGASKLWTDTLWPWVRGIGGKIIGLYVKANVWLFDAGMKIVDGLKSGIVSGFTGIAKWVKAEIVDPLVNAVKSWFGIHSPSTVMAGIGGHLISGLMKGLTATGADQIAKYVFGSLPDALGAIVDKGLLSIAALPSKALSALGGLAGNVGSWFTNLFGGGSGGNSNPNVSLGQAMAKAMGWTGGNWNALYNLWMGESGWNQKALNPGSGAYGIPQALPADKMASAGGDWRTNPATQIKWGLGYIDQVYGSPANAYSKWLSRSPHWYGHGGTFAAGDLIGVGDRGPELLQFGQPGRVFSPEETRALLAAAGKGGDGGHFTGHLVLDSGELVGIIEGVIEREEQDTIRGLKSGSGSRR